MVRFILITCFLISSLSYAQHDEVAQNMAKAETQSNLGNYAQALVTLEDVLVVKPDHLPAQEMKITLLSRLDREKEAMKDIEGYIDMYPGKPEYMYLRGILLLQKEKYSKAIDDFDRVLLMNMPYEWLHKVYLSRGMAHFHNHDFELAEADFNEVITIDSRNVSAYQGKGMVLYELQEYEKAIAEFQKALKLNEDNAIIHYNLAMSYYRLDDEENACFHFNKSCVLGHRNACRLYYIECDANIPE